MAESVRPIPDGGFFCMLCSKVVKHVRPHFVDRHWTEAPVYRCPAPECQKVYTSQGAFKKHRMRYHPDWTRVPLDAFLDKSQD